MTNSTTVDAAATAAYDATLPRKRMAAGVLFFDQDGRVLLVDPVYKPPWEIPGGTVEADESPRAAAQREIAEELGLLVPVGRLLALDWVAARPGRSEGLMTVFDGGLLPAEVAARIRLQDAEVRSWRFVSVDGVGRLLSTLVAARVRAAAGARATRTVAYLENGQLTDALQETPDYVRESEGTEDRALSGNGGGQALPPSAADPSAGAGVVSKRPAER